MCMDGIKCACYLIICWLVILYSYYCHYYLVPNSYPLQVQNTSISANRLFCFSRGETESLLQYLNSHDIDIENCQGQSYDNASNMSGRYNSLQAKLKNRCPYAKFIPCFGHSLNLVGNCCADSCQQAILFFNFASGLYIFFSGSTSRWKILTTAITKINNQGYTLKRLCGTCWAERADAALAIERNYKPIKSALEQISNNTEQKAEVRVLAEGFLSTMCKLETAFMIIFWNKVLQRFQATSGCLQVNFTIDYHETAAQLCYNGSKNNKSQKYIEFLDLFFLFLYNGCTKKFE